MKPGQARRGGADPAPASGLIILRASRTEALVQPLHELLHALRPDDPLVPQTVIAAHPGMKQWLTGALARHAGPSGIVANLDVMLPSAWLDRLATQVLGHRAVSLPRYQRKHLRWTLHELLGRGGAIRGFDDPRITAYLAGSAPLSAADRARRRFQLADRLASIYSRYLVYRPDWLAAWEGGARHAAVPGSADAPLRELEARLLAPLWRHVARALGTHRSAAIAELCERLRQDGAERPPLYLFGLSHLPPAEMAVLRAYARTAPVALYVPDPCREFWGREAGDDTVSWADFGPKESTRIAAAGDGDYWLELKHPLLSRWGRMGQHFFATLADGDVRMDERHGADKDPEQPRNRLQRLQESIRRFDPAVLLEEPRIAAGACEDASLRVHACHTRLRELEVLRDALLHAIETEGVRAHDIVVMAPDITAYAPLIPSVFGEPGDPRQRLLPYHLADVPIARSHRLFNTVERLLDLAASRVSTPEVVDFLGVPEVQAALGVDEDGREHLVEWLRQSHVAWGLDAQHRTRFGLPASSGHSFAWAMDRMLAGYLMADSAEDGRQPAVVLADGTELLPVTGIHGPAAEALGALDRLLLELQHWQDLSAKSLPASAWSQEIAARLEAIFRIDRRDADARAAMAALQRIVAAIAAEPSRAGEDPVLHFAVVRDLLLDALQQVPERQRFLMGGITFCGMVPQRAIPFAVVCVLGLDDGAFPRKHNDGGLDLMARVRRLGDRDVRMDDRYLFLETAMSARKRLHLSYIGEGVKDGKPRNPAAPLAELMAPLDAAIQARMENDARAQGEEPKEIKDADRPWLVRHPLQPFDARYFAKAKDPRLFTYQPRFAAMWGEGTGQPAPFLDQRALAAGAPTPDAFPQPLPLSSLMHYFKAPAEHLLKRRLHLSLEAVETETLADCEPLDETIARVHSVARRVFFEHALPAWARGEAWDGQAPDWVRLSGLLPEGRIGEQAWQAEGAVVEALLALLPHWPALTRSAAGTAHSAEIDITLPAAGPDLPGLRITATATGLYHLDTDAGPGVLMVRAFTGGSDGVKAATDLHFGDLVPLFLEWTALRLHTAASARQAGDALPAVRLVALAQDAEQLPLLANLHAWDAQLRQTDRAGQDRILASLERTVRRFVQLWRAAQANPSWYFPKTAWKALQARVDAQAQAGEGDAGASDPLAAARTAARSAWIGRDNRGERDYAPGFSALLAGDVAFGDHTADPDDRFLLALLEHAEQLASMMTLAVPQQVQQ